ncbi:MAG: DUF262 domain-containing protein [Rickettsiales bacterium]
MTELFTPSNASFKDIIGNGKKYKIPPYQRDYSWSEENWEDLWNDFLSVEKTGNPHYTGSIVLNKIDKDGDEYEVIDGQQRLTTLTIYAVSTISILKELISKNIDVSENNVRINLIGSGYIGIQDMTSLLYTSKLTLNKNNDTFFQDYILRIRNPISYNKLKDSEKSLYDCYNYFKNQISLKFKEDGEKMTNFLDNIVGKKMFFIRIVVDEDTNAFTIFETLNARGVDLTTTDLIKNYLFIVCSKLPESQMEVIEDKWNLLVHQIGLKEFPIFLRYYLNSKQELVRKDRLFKSIKSDIKNTQDVIELLDKLTEKEVLYNALKDPNDELWNDYDNKTVIVNSLKELKLFGSTQQIPLLFAIHDKLKDLFPIILRDLASLVFRYNTICKKNPNEMETVYNNIAQKIYKSEITEKNQIYQNLEKIYVNDKDFKQSFSGREISSSGNNKRLIKYILTKIENQESGSDNSWDDSSSTIEHILPQKPDDQWENNFNNNSSKYIFRIGNYTLLETKLNKKCGNNNYEIKKKSYMESKYLITKKYCLKDDWDSGTINEYQEKLAKIASSVWKISF